MKINTATEKDSTEIQKLAQQSWQENYTEILSQEQIQYMLNLMYSDSEFKAQFRNKNYRYFLIKNESEKSVGFMGVEKDAEPDTTKLHRLYLLQSEKGKGFGKLAIQFLKDWTLKAGNSRIILNVNKDNPAQKFYTNAGFSTYDEGIFDIGNGFVMDDFLMEIKIR